MDTTIITAIITGITTLGVCLVNNYFQQRKQDADQDKRMTEIANENEKSIMKMKAYSEQSVAEMSAQTQQAIAILDCKFDELTRKVEKHNCLVERTYKLESESGLMQEKIKVVNHRLDDLEKRGA